MAENETTTKVEDQKTAGATEQNSEELLSLENLDSIIAEVDPEFAQSMSQIGPDDPSLGIHIEETDLEFRLEDEIKYWKESAGWRARVATSWPFIVKIAYHFKLKQLNFRLSIRNFKEKARYTIKNAGPLTVKFFKKSAENLKEGLIDFLGAFKEFSIGKKLAFVGLLVVTGASGYVIFRIINHKFLPPSEELFLPTLEEWAQEKYFYDPKTEVESFYDSTRASQNMIIIKKMVVNLHRTANSGGNPMGAFEFFVEGTDAEVVVEIKDRESEVRDLFIRTIGDMSFDQLSSGEGKQMLGERLRKEVNKILTKGRVRRVFIKTAIVKP